MNSTTPILIVDDDDDTADAVCDLLLGAGFEVDHARNGLAGLDYLRAHARPAMILLDWNMPIMNGRQMMQELQSEPAWRMIPIVLFTADPEAKSMALEMRANGYLKKPFVDLDLLTMVDTTLRNPS